MDRVTVSDENGEDIEDVFVPCSEENLDSQEPYDNDLALHLTPGLHSHPSTHERITPMPAPVSPPFSDEFKARLPKRIHT